MFWHLSESAARAQAGTEVAALRRQLRDDLKSTHDEEMLRAREQADAIVADADARATAERDSAEARVAEAARLLESWVVPRT